MTTYRSPKLTITFEVQHDADFDPAFEASLVSVEPRGTFTTPQLDTGQLKTCGRCANDETNMYVCHACAVEQSINDDIGTHYWLEYAGVTLDRAGTLILIGYNNWSSFNTEYGLEQDESFDVDVFEWKEASS